MRIVVANWKMYSVGARGWVRGFVGAGGAGDSCVVVCPPAVYFDSVRRVLPEGVALGAQNVADRREDGAYTGEVSARMAAGRGCRFVIVGHSERRRHFGESNTDCAGKIIAAVGAGLRPILCVGETQEQRGQGLAGDVVVRQLAAAEAAAVMARSDLGEAAGAAVWENLVVAYEPVWAIGSGRTPTGVEISAAHCAIRERLISQSGAFGGKIPVLYGGSVRADNAAGIFACDGVGGALVGGASLDAAEFSAVCRA